MAELFSHADKCTERQHHDNCRVRKALWLNSGLSGFAMSFRAFSTQAMVKVSWEMKHRCPNSVQIKYRWSKLDKNQRYILGLVIQKFNEDHQNIFLCLLSGSSGGRYIL